MAQHPYPFTRTEDITRRFRLPSFPPFAGLNKFVRSLPPSDKFIVLILGILIGLVSVMSLFALMRHFQVIVPAHGGTLTEGVVGAPRFVNPLLATSDTDRDLVALTYAGLLGHDASGALVPVLAESHTVSDDGTMYTFTLRSNAKFSDGTPVTSDDVVYTVQKAQDPGLKSPLLASWANIRAEAVDARTVRFTLPKAYAPFLEDTTLGILPKHVWSGVTDEEFPFSPYTADPVGAGPFTVTTVTRDGKGVVTGYDLASFADFATGQPYLAHIRLSFFADQASLKQALAGGMVKSAYGVAVKGAQVVPYARVFGVFFNPTEEPLLADVGVRKALSLAIDRDALVKNVLGGYATATAGPLPSGSDVAPVPLPDPATHLDDAKAALTAAGWKFDAGQGLWTNTKSGKSLKLTLKTSNVPELKAVATEVQSDWQALGVPTELQLNDPNELTQSVIRPRAYGALLFGEVVGTNPDLYAFWDSSGKADPGLNIANYSNTTVDTLLQQARAEAQGPAKQATLADIQTRIAADYPAAFLYTPDFVYSVPSGLHGVALTRVSAPSDRFWDASHWYLYTEHVWPFLLKKTS
ncbi:MAG: family 5 extracellular solute-binding protein peptide/nickel transport system substrate-binding [Parcubacteria group bacterium]|nr:family 5 extracellular solute-binding protein peptide/nickel transport system substrate-binding [Parcubacteria group bacterium]